VLFRSITIESGNTISLIRLVLDIMSPILKVFKRF